MELWTPGLVFAFLWKNTKASNSQVRPRATCPPQASCREVEKDESWYTPDSHARPHGSRCRGWDPAETDTQLWSASVTFSPSTWAGVLFTVVTFLVQRRWTAFGYVIGTGSVTSLSLICLSGKQSSRPLH